MVIVQRNAGMQGAASRSRWLEGRVTERKSGTMELACGGRRSDFAFGAVCSRGPETVAWTTDDLKRPSQGLPPAPVPAVTVGPPFLKSFPTLKPLMVCSEEITENSFLGGMTGEIELFGLHKGRLGNVSREGDRLRKLSDTQAF